MVVAEVAAADMAGVVSAVVDMVVSAAEGMVVGAEAVGVEAVAGTSASVGITVVRRMAIRARTEVATAA